MKAILQRDHKASDKVVFGKLYLPWLKGHPDIYTVEILNCIPAGIYELVGHQGEKKDVWELRDVPGHTGILLHVGNYACTVGEHESDSLGCILAGFGIEEDVPMITQSISAIRYLRVIWGVKNQGEPINVSLEVRD